MSEAEQTIPTVGINNVDMAQALRESAMLADVTIGVWRAEKSDRATTDKVKADAGATGNVGRFIKNILAGADGKLKDVQGAYAAIRQLHYRYTLPWSSDPHAERQTGPRLLPLAVFDEYLKALFAQKRVAEALLDEFMLDYSDMVRKAKANLGNLADADYPDVHEVRKAFRAVVDYNPLPAGSDFRGLPDRMLDRLSKRLNEKQEAMVAQAQAEMWDRARKRVQHLVERLGDPEAKFHSSTVENLRELIGMLPGWNFNKDPRVAEIVQDISGMLHGLDAEALRSDARVRQETAIAGHKVVDKLNKWGL